MGGCLAVVEGGEAMADCTVTVHNMPEPGVAELYSTDFETGNGSDVEQIRQKRRITSGEVVEWIEDSAYVVPRLMQVVLYICAQNSEVNMDRKGRAGPPRTAAAIKDRYREIRLWDVGCGIVSRLQRSGGRDGPDEKEKTGGIGIFTGWVSEYILGNLRTRGAICLEYLQKWTYDDFKQIRGLGPLRIGRILDKLKQYGLESQIKPQDIG